jgi:hypothetical protein
VSGGGAASGLEPLSVETPTLFGFRYAPPGTERHMIAFSFLHPTPQEAVGQILPMDETPSPPSADAGQGAEILFIPLDFKNEARSKDFARQWLAGDTSAAEARVVKEGDILVSWKPLRTMVVAPARGAAATLQSIVDFAYHDAALRQIETTVEGNWDMVESDASLTYVITAGDLKKDAAIGRRMQTVLRSRLQLSRIEPRLLRPDPGLPPFARDLGETLRAAALCEDRLDAADGQIETQQYVYELASQRLGEHRHARQSFVLEVVIIILLALEAILMAVTTR